jgi:hypothetical protein
MDKTDKFNRVARGEYDLITEPSVDASLAAKTPGVAFGGGQGLAAASR